MDKHPKVSDDVKSLLKTVYDDCMKEDEAVRQRQIRNWRRLKLLWEGFQRIWYSEVAHDWRIWDEIQNADSDQGSYDKPINVFRAYLESIIAALSVTVPAVKCFPDDADNAMDLATAKAGDKIGQLIYRHNNVPLLWLHSLFIYSTEGLTAFENYTKSDKKYGMYDEKNYDLQNEQHEVTSCPNCSYQLSSQQVDPSTVSTPPISPMPMADMPQDSEMDNGDEYDPSITQQESCPACGSLMNPEISQQTITVERLTGVTKQPKSRVCISAWGGLYVKVPNYARTQDDCPYLIKSQELDYSLVCAEYELDGPELLKSIKTGRNTPSGYDQYAMWGRLSPQYSGEYPLNVVTVNKAWIRPAKFKILDEDKCKELTKKFPNGVCVTLVNEEVICAYDESLDDHWTLLYNPLADYIHFEPLGNTLTSVQDITNDIISLVLQTIEHGISQTFADPGVLDFKAYQQTEVTPGAIFPTKTQGSKNIGDGFYELKTSTLSGEVLPFYQSIQSMGQLTSGALPSLFGGAIEGSETASQYSMSRAQALQRLQNAWKMLTYCWKDVFSKAIPAYIKEVKEDERDVQRGKDGNFVNVFIRKAELDGTIGKIELDANENLPMTWGQIKDTYEKLLLNQNPLIQQILTQPENIHTIHEALGLPDLFVPGEQDVENQYEEIKLLLNSAPIPTADEQVPEVPSIEIEPDFDDHKVHFEICRKWIISDAGRQAKIDNNEGYMNVLLHAKAHQSEMMTQMEQANMQAQQVNGAPNPEKPNPLTTKDAPITENSDVSVH